MLIDDDGAPRFDLQSHSTRSDGTLEPAEVVAAAAAAGVRLLALTDHDTVDGVDEALAAGAEQGVVVVPAVEISTVDELGEDFHVLGYCVDHTDPGLAAALARWRADRAARIDRMADQLTLLGLPPDRTEIEARRAAGLPVGRPHLASAAIEAHGERLHADGLDECSAFLEAYLCKGRPAYSRRTTPTVPEAIEAIHAAGGVAVWAHPFWDVDAGDDVCRALERFSAAGLDGVEAFYATHDGPQTRLLCEEAARLGLLTTGSADFHGPQHSRFSRFRAFGLHGCEPRLGPIAEGAARRRP
ncbi:MAG: 3,5-nucleoside bisphosphate phosphatase [Solirubrobacteraceae bacterium]|nr:3,5-nucleoside bisphosphate phosphatase [Solirubrobacteraceae bacterium]